MIAISTRTSLSGSWEKLRLACSTRLSPTFLHFFSRKLIHAGVLQISLEHGPLVNPVNLVKTESNTVTPFRFPIPIQIPGRISGCSLEQSTSNADVIFTRSVLRDPEEERNSRLIRYNCFFFFFFSNKYTA